MRWYCGLIVVCSAFTLSFAAAPPARVPPELLQLIDQLGDDDKAVRDRASAGLIVLGDDYLGLFEALGKTHADVDVRLRLQLIAGEIKSVPYGEVRKYEGNNTYLMAVA